MNAAVSVLRSPLRATGCWLIPLLFLCGCAYDMAPLQTAIRTDKTERALEMIAEGKYINSRDPLYGATMGQTPLYCASAQGQEEVVVALLKAGADVHLEEECQGKLPIHAAAMNGHARIAGLLAENGANVNARDDGGRLPLVFAAGGGHAETVRVLLERGAEVNAQEQSGQFALAAASRRGHLEAVQELVQGGADVNTKGSDGWTPLTRAAAGHHTDVAQFLIQKGANIDVAGQNGRTALMIAAAEGDMNSVKMLVENHAAPHIQGTDPNWTALHFAAYGEHAEITDYLIDCGVRADPVSSTERDCYATAFSSKLLARHYDEGGDRQVAIGHYTTAGEYYERASDAYKERSREIGSKISSAKLADLGRFVGAVALSAAGTAATGGRVVFYPTGASTTNTTDLSTLKKDCDRRIKESSRCAAACRQIVECYQSGDSGKKTEKRLKDAREKLGFL